MRTIEFRKRAKSGEAAEKYLLPSCSSHVEEFMASLRVNEVSNYSVFTFQLLRNLQLWISELVNECTVLYLSLDKLRTAEALKGTNAFDIIKAWGLWCSSFVLSTLKSIATFPGIYIVHSKIWGSNLKDRRIIWTFLRWILGEEDSRAWDTGFYFVAAFTNKSTEHKKTASMTRIHMRCSESVGNVTGDMWQQTWSVENLSSLERKKKRLKAFSRDVR